MKKTTFILTILALFPLIVFSQVNTRQIQVINATLQGEIINIFSEEREKNFLPFRLNGIDSHYWEYRQYSRQHLQSDAF